MTGAGEERSGVYRVWSRHSDRSSLKQVAEISFSVQGKTRRAPAAARPSARHSAALRINLSA